MPEPDPNQQLMAFCMDCKTAYVVDLSSSVPLAHECCDTVLWPSLTPETEELLHQRRQRSRRLHPSQFTVIDGDGEPSDEMVPPPELRIIR